MPTLTPAATKLIIEYEVGGGEKYYDKLLMHPTWPGGHSGVTIGVGYDLGYNSSSQFQADWGTRLSATDFAALKGCLGATGVKAKGLIPDVKKISVPWIAASAVFFANTVPRFYKEAENAFPGLDKLPGDAQGALVSLVFNRGAGMKSGKHDTKDSRREMRAIRELVPKGDLKGIAAQLRSMERLWGKDQSGLIKRREAEAKLVENAKGGAPTTEPASATSPAKPTSPGSPTSPKAPADPFTAPGNDAGMTDMPGFGPGTYFA